MEYYNNGKTTLTSLSGHGNNSRDAGNCAESAARKKTVETISTSQIKGGHKFNQPRFSLGPFTTFPVLCDWGDYIEMTLVFT